MGFDTIWHAVLNGQDTHQSFDAPIGAQVLAVKQRPPSEGTLLRPPAAEVWFRCNPDLDRGPLPVRLVGTGWPDCPDVNFRYVDSIFMHHGREVYHVFVGDAWDASGALSTQTVHLSYTEREARGLWAPAGDAVLRMRERIDAYMPPPPPPPAGSPPPGSR